MTRKIFLASANAAAFAMAALLLLGHSTSAQAESEQQRKWMDTQFGILAGAGYGAFVGDSLSSRTDGGITWDARLILGAHSPIALEAAYIGTHNGFSNNDASIMSHGFEGDVRLGTPSWYNLPLQLYGFVGLGFSRFSLSVPVTSMLTYNTDVDTTFALPFGGGIQFNLGPKFILDTRFTYRAMFDEQLVDRQQSLDMWTVTGKLGVLF